MLDTQSARDAALNYQKFAKRYAIGDEDFAGSETDNAKFYYEQVKEKGSLLGGTYLAGWKALCIIIGCLAVTANSLTDDRQKNIAQRVVNALSGTTMNYLEQKINNALYLSFYN